MEKICRKIHAHNRKGRAVSNREYTGIIKKFYPETNEIKIDNTVYMCSEELFLNIEKHFLVGDSVKIELHAFGNNIKCMILFYRKGAVS